ncbi:hypothetical protein K0U27_01080 [archaeon]|nr:hypothetical protein [archaeon]
MIQKIPQITKLLPSASFRNTDCNNDESFRKCPYCGQRNIAFKQEVCVCGANIDKIHYIQNLTTSAKGQYYCYVG